MQALMLLAFASAAASAAPVSAEDWCIVSVEESGPAGPGDGALSILDKQGKRLARVPIGEKPHEVAVSSDGHTAFVSHFGITDYDSRIGTPGTTIVRIDVAAAREVSRFALPDDVRGPHGVKLRPPAEGELFVNAEVGGDTMVVFDVANGRVKRRFPLPKGTHNFIFSKDGAAVFAFAGAEGVYRIDAESGEISAHRKFASPVRGLVLATDGRVLAAAKGEVVALDPASLEVAQTVAFSGLGQFIYLDVFPDGRIVVPARSDGGIAIRHPRDAQHRFATTGRTPIFTRVGPDGRVYVANVEDNHLSVVDPGTMQATSLGDLSEPNGLGFAVCPD